MCAVQIDPQLTDDDRRAALYQGDLIFYSPTPGMTALCDLAWEMIQEAFHPIAPERAQFEMPVEEFVEIISKVKPAFTHHPEAKKALRTFFENIGADPEETYFDVPKLRIVSTDGYLTAGMGYAYKAHRDIWYACPESQINWWTPIRPITARRGLAFYPDRFAQAVPNNSNDFDAYQWNADGRKNAGKYITSDPRPHPRFQGETLEDPQIILGAPASVIGFSAQHLHATVPNDSGETRFSIDFRTVHRQDIVDHKGAVLTDNSSTGTTLRDFMRATDHERFSEEVIATYDDGKDTNGVLVFQPEQA